MEASPVAVPGEEAEKAGRDIVFFKLKQNLLKFLLN